MTAVIVSIAHYLCIIASITVLVIFFLEPSRLASRVLFLSLALTGVTWIFGYFTRRQTHCPLCKGTPLLNTGALPHQKAVKWFPFNHGITATLSIILFQKFRCMFCGTLFDMLKRLVRER